MSWGERRGIGQSGNESIEMNPTGTTGGNYPQGNDIGSFNIFNSHRGISDHTNSISLWNGAAISENPRCDSLLKILCTRINLKLKKMGTKFLKSSFNWITMSWITLTRIIPTWLSPTQKTLNQKIKRIWPTIVHYIKWYIGNYIIYKLVQFLQQRKAVNFPWAHIWHIITCSWYIHTLWYLYHIPKSNSLTEQVTLHHHQMNDNLHQVSHIQEILCHTATHPNRYHTYQMTLI